MVLNEKQIVAKFRRIIGGKQLGVLGGAGISIASGIPDAFTMTEIMLRAMKCKKNDLDLFFGRKAKASRGTLPVAFELIIGTIAEKIRFSSSRDNFLKIFARNCIASPNQNHLFWSGLLKNREILFIATTNFDTCFEQAMKTKPLSDRVLYPYGRENVNLRKRSIYNRIIKLHGCMADPRTIGTTVQQISKRESISSIDTLVDKLFRRGKHKLILILGYSCSDGMDIGPKIMEIGQNSNDKQKVQVIYWIFRPGSTTFQFEKMKHARITNDNRKAKIAFKDYKNTMQVTGDLDLFTRLISGGSLPKKVSNFGFTKKISNPLLTLGAVFQSAGYYELAIKYIRRNLSNKGQEIETYTDLGVAYNYNGQFDHALKFHLRALSILIKTRPKAHKKRAELNNLIGENYRDLGHFDKAIEHYDIALNLYLEKTKGNELTVAKIYNNLSDVHRSKELFDESIEWCEKSLKIRLDKLGEINHLVSNSYNNLASAYSGLNLYGKSLFYHRKALRIRKTIFGDRHDWVAQSNINLGAVYYKRKRPKQAIKYLELAQEIYADRVGDEHPILATISNNLGNAYLLLKNYPEAILNYKDAVRIWSKAHGRKYHLLAYSYHGMGKAYRDSNEKSRAKWAFNQGISLLRNTPHERLSIFAAISESIKNLG